MLIKKRSVPRENSVIREKKFSKNNEYKRLSEKEEMELQQEVNNIEEIIPEFPHYDAHRRYEGVVNGNISDINGAVESNFRIGFCQTVPAISKESVEKILSFLDWEDLENLSLTCRSMRDGLNLYRNAEFPCRRIYITERVSSSDLWSVFRPSSPARYARTHADMLWSEDAWSEISLARAIAFNNLLKDSWQTLERAEIASPNLMHRYMEIFSLSRMSKLKTLYLHLMNKIGGETRLGPLLSDLRRSSTLRTLSIRVDDPELGEEGGGYEVEAEHNHSLKSVKFTLDRLEPVLMDFVHNCRLFKNLFINATHIDDILIRLFFITINRENLSLEYLGIRGISRFPTVTLTTVTQLRVSLFSPDGTRGSREIGRFLDLNPQIRSVTVVEDERREGEKAFTLDLNAILGTDVDNVFFEGGKIMYQLMDLQNVHMVASNKNIDKQLHFSCRSPRCNVFLDEHEANYDSKRLGDLIERNVNIDYYESDEEVVDYGY